MSNAVTEPTGCENGCGSKECDEYYCSIGWVCQECKDNLESDEQWEEDE
jgi:hypothetical protein